MNINSNVVKDTCSDRFGPYNVGNPLELMQAWPENVLPPLLFGALSLLLVGTLLVSIAHYPARRDRRIKLMVVTAGSLMAAPAESHNVLHSGHRTPET